VPDIDCAWLRFGLASIRPGFGSAWPQRGLIRRVWRARHPGLGRFGRDRKPGV